MRTTRRIPRFVLGLVILGTFWPVPTWAATSFIGGFSRVDVLASTVPANGDVNPYGVAVVPRSIGTLVEGNVLVSNFNNRKNRQGTGTTIVQVAPDGTQTLFAEIKIANAPHTCPGGIGLTTALAVLPSGWVIVGSLPTANGKPDTARAGCLLVLNNSGQLVQTIVGDPINGPWDMTAVQTDEHATLFVTNVLNGTVAASSNVVFGGTVVRIDLVATETTAPVVLAETVIGSGFPERTDPSALVIGPTGVGLDADDNLYVADTLNNRIVAIPNASTRELTAGVGETVFTGGALNGPLGLAIAPNGDVLTVNSGDGNMVEITPEGAQVAVKAVDHTNIGAGTLFGLAVTPDGTGVYFVNDGDNTLDLLH